MKKSLMTTLVAASMLSPVAFAAGPMELSTAQMDIVTAGTNNESGNYSNYTSNFNFAWTLQIVNQEAIAINLGDGSATAVNVAYVSNDVHQH